MNMLQSSDQRMKSIKENTILSFNAAARHPLDFIEFDVQVSLNLFLRRIIFFLFFFFFFLGVVSGGKMASDRAPFVWVHVSGQLIRVL